jgi:hypothetical protein
MATNFYFQSGDTSGTTAEQRLVEDLVVESLKIYGHDIYYMPRSFVNRDTIFDEDELSKFEQAYPLEMYLENTEGFEGDGELFQRFGIEIRDQATFVMARRRWDDMVNTSGGTFVGDGARPMEGDLLFFPKTRSLFEIKFVQFQDPFYQLGKIYVFKMVCELFEYSSEAIDTGLAGIDQLEDDNTVDQLLFELVLEDASGTLQLEDGGSLIKEDYAIKPSVSGDNADFLAQETATNILDFTESNPFGDL